MQLMTAVTIARTRVIDASPDRAWNIIADLDDYHSHVRGLATTEVVSGEGAGAVRHCVDTRGGDWYETCDVWEPGERYSVNVDVSTYPWLYRLLFSSFRGTWHVAPRDGRAEIGIRFDATIRRLPFATRLVAKLVEQSNADIEAIFDSYEASAVDA